MSEACKSEGCTYLNCDKIGALGADCSIWAVDCAKVEPPGRVPSSPKYGPKLLLEKKI